MSATGPLVSFVLATYNRPDDLAEAIESILAQAYESIEVVVVSSSTDETRDLFAAGGRFDRDDVQYHEFDERMGVPAARNIGYDLASGDVLVTIDDDAILAHPGATTEVVSLFEEHDDVGVVAFQSRSYETDEPILMEIPDPPTMRAVPDEQYRASSFCGVGNAIRRELIDDVGKFPADFVYGFEEHDLSLRLLDRGWDILYAPSIQVYHKRTPKERLPPAVSRERQVENRIRLAVRNLPWRYVLFTTLVWSLYLVVTARLSPRPVVRILGNICRQRDALLAERRVIDRRTLKLLKSRNTLLFAWWFGANPRRIFANPRRLTW